MSKKCRKCGAELATTDTHCPNCGFKQKKTRFEVFKENFLDYHKSMGTPSMIFLYIILIIIIISTCVIIVHSIPWSDGLGAENITLTTIETEIEDKINNEDIDEDSDRRYTYIIDFKLNDVSQDFVGSEVVTYLYNGDELVQIENNGEIINNDTQVMFIDEGYRNGSYYINSNYHKDLKLYCDYVFFHSRDLINVTDFKVIVIHDGKVIFEDKKPFNMSNIIVK